MASARNATPVACAALTLALTLTLTLGLLATLPAAAQLPPPDVRMDEGLPPILQAAGIDQKLDAQVPLDATFVDASGATVRLGDLLGERPTVLVPAYYTCPMLCSQVLNGTARMMNIVKLDLGRDYQVVTVSFDPRDTPETAAASKRGFVGRVDDKAAEQGWHFLTGDEAEIRKVTDAVGFNYQWDPEQGQYAHASALIVLTPQGRVSKYFFGIEYSARDVRLGLVEASDNKIGTPVDQLLLYCYLYNPATGKYGAVVMNMLRVAAIVTVIAIIAMIVLLRPAWSKRRDEPPTPPTPIGGAGSEARPDMATWIPLRPEVASTIAPEVDKFWFFLCALTVFFCVLIAALELYFALKYRRQHPDEVPLPVRSSTRLEMVWIVIPFILSMVIFAWGASLFFTMHRVPEGAMPIYVTGKQWMWRVQHMEGKREINELHVPVGRKVKLIMTSEDVLHGFFIPAFRVKWDVLPGRYTTLWFEATKTGRFHLFCTEYCGTNHSRMIGWVTVMEPADYQAWLAGETTRGTLASTGEQLFEQLACQTCHQQDNEGRGPVLDGLFGNPVQLADGRSVIADENYLRESILNPQAKIKAGYGAPVLMPTFQGQVSEDQLMQLIEYIRSLGDQETASAQTAAAGVGP